MPTLEKGVVRSFTMNGGLAPFGFIAVTGSASTQDVCFSWDNYFSLEFKSQNTFCFSRRIYPRPMRTVRVGETVYFERKSGDGRPQASMWCFEADFERALGDLEQRLPGSALMFLKGSAWWDSLIERIDLTEIGLTGHVSTPERDAAQNKGLRGLTDFEKKILGPSIEAEKKLSPRVVSSQHDRSVGRRSGRG